MKQCNHSGCEESKARRGNGYYFPYCRKHYQIHKKSKLYSITVDEVELLQKIESCAVCGKHKSTERYGKLHIDHCHETGTIRGMLCGNCNTALGLLQDDPDNIRELLNYLNG